jgi:hypothetical protein
LFVKTVLGRLISHSIVFEQVPSYVLMGIPHETASSTQQLTLTPFGEACLRMDLTAILEILEKMGYKDDEGIANEVCHCLSSTQCSSLNFEICK